MPDYVQTVLGFIDTNWSTGNYDPKPILRDRRDGSWYNASRRTESVDLTTVGNNVIGISDAPIDTFTPEGLGWSHDRVEAGLSVRAEGLHESEHGIVADAPEWETFTDELLRTLRVERKRPITGYYRLEVRDETGMSANHGDYYRTDYEVYFVGNEALP